MNLGNHCKQTEGVKVSFSLRIKSKTRVRREKVGGFNPTLQTVSFGIMLPLIRDRFTLRHVSGNS